MPETISNSRLETFCDGIFAIAITLLILEVKIPETENIHSGKELLHMLSSQWPSGFSFLLTFLTLLIAWVNHHHMAASLDKTSSVFIYANGFLMLTVIIFPFTAGVLGRFMNTGYSSIPIVIYCSAIFLHSIAWLTVFTAALSPKNLAKDEAGKKKIADTRKVVSYTCVFNLANVVLAFWFPVISLCLVTGGWIYYVYAGIVYTSIE